MAQLSASMGSAYSAVDLDGECMVELSKRDICNILNTVDTFLK